MSGEDTFTSDYAFVKPAHVTLDDYHRFQDNVDELVVGRGPLEDRPDDMSDMALWFVTEAADSALENVMTRYDADTSEWIVVGGAVSDEIGGENNPINAVWAEMVHATQGLDVDGTATATTVEAESVGVTVLNDTTAYLEDGFGQTELAAAESHLTTNFDGGEIVIPDGTHADEWAITEDNITLRGRSKSTTLTLPDGMDEPSQVLTITGDDVVVENLTIDGNRDNQDLSGYARSDLQHADGIGIYADNGLIRNVDVYRTQSHSIIVWNWNNDLGAANASLPAEEERFGNRIVDCHLEDNGHSNNERASLDTVESRRTIFRDNEIVAGDFTASGITIHTGDDITIRGNHIQTEDLGMQLHTGAYNVVVDGNKIYSDSGVGQGVQLYNDTDNITFTNNTILGDDTRPNLVAIEGTASNIQFGPNNTVSGGNNGSLRAYTDTENVQIVDNTFVDGARVRVASGASNVQIRGNQFVNYEFWMCEIEDATGVQIQNNHIYHPASVTGLAGSIVLDDGIDCVVSENTIVNSHGIFEGSGSSGNDIRDNHEYDE